MDDKMQLTPIIPFFNPSIADQGTSIVIGNDNIFTKQRNQWNKSFTTNVIDPNRIYKSSNISDEPISQDTFNTTNVYERRSINIEIKLDKVNTYNNFTRVQEHQNQD